MSKHTPGPWRMNFDTDHTWFLETEEFCIGEVAFWTDNNERANARLIAAAPDLLEALEMIADFPNTTGNRDMTFSEAVSEMAHIAFAAIAKAKGETL